MPDTGTNQPTTGMTAPMMAGGGFGANSAMGGGEFGANPAMPTAPATRTTQATQTTQAMQDIPEEVTRQKREVLDKDVVVKPTTQAADLEIRDKEKQNLTEVQKTVIQQVKELHNVLIALSSDPSVDELAAAIGVTIYLDKIGKRATAIYSGETPNALEFLKPEDTFDHSADVLQDFVIALNKDKADHLRYKLDGDFVRIYITPYRAKITADDLEYSYGDYNVDLVLALDVANGVDLDEALREHGRIMHDAVVVDVTTGNPGKLGEIQWADKNASSVSEMLAGMIYHMEGGEPMGEEEATAFLTGIVAATNRFSSAGTTPTTMEIASRLMESGAKHQLISKNITGEVSNELFQMGQEKDEKETRAESENEIADEEISIRGEDAESEKNDKNGEVSEKDEVNEEAQPEDDTEKAEDVENVGVEDAEQPEENEEVKDTGKMGDIVGPISVDEPEGAMVKEPEVTGGMEPEVVANESVANEANMNGAVANEKNMNGAVANETEPEEDLSLLNDIKAAEESLKGAGAETVAEKTEKPMMIEGGQMVQETEETPVAASIESKPEKVIEPTSDMTEEGSGGMNKYGQMLQDALNGANGMAMDGNMTEAYASEGMMDASGSYTPEGMANNVGEMAAPGGVASGNVAEAYAPEVPSAPEVNGVPEMNYMPMPGDQVLPPPPAPPIDMDAPLNADGLAMPEGSQMGGQMVEGVPMGGVPMNEPVTNEMPMGGVPMDEPMTNGMPMGGQMVNEAPMNGQMAAPGGFEGTPMTAELPNVVMNEPMTEQPQPVAEQPVMEPVPRPEEKPVEDAMTSEPYDPSAFRIPGIK